MTGAIRTEIRNAARAALGAVSGWTVISAWVQDVDVTLLPACAVATPQARQEVIDHDRNQSHDITLAVVLKRAGEPDEIENVLDSDGDQFAALIEAAINTDGRMCQLTSTSTRIDRGGARPVGTMSLEFNVTAWS